MGSPMGGEFIENADGSRSVRFDDGRVERVPEDGERGLGVSQFPLYLRRGMEMRSGIVV